ncbi:glycosyltransferase family 2 protein [Actinoplanes sp. NPDC024001]|uniref:glycosyltransferase family 2 protein n=1 Tax=Actinoplanes sp. NPDC024001 TaxID=3154598 RepID=UPI0033EB89F1
MSDNTAPTVSVVIPALNEARTIAHLLERLGPEVQVVLVDGGSVDRTIEVTLQHRPDATVVRPTRTGKGNALACGFAACTGDIIAVIDADGPAGIAPFVAALTAGADCARAARSARLGSLLSGSRCTVFWRRIVPLLELPDPALPRPADGGPVWGDGLEVETLIHLRLAAAGVRVAEVAMAGSPLARRGSALTAAARGLRTIAVEQMRQRRLRSAQLRSV